MENKNKKEITIKTLRIEGREKNEKLRIVIKRILYQHTNVSMM